MTKPDLVSKLREVIAEWRKRAELADVARKNGAVSQLTEYAMRTIMADDIERLLAVEPHELESLLGREGQAAREITPEMMSHVFAKSVNNTDPEHGHIYDHRIAAAELNRMLASQPAPSTPIVTPNERFVSRDEFNDKIADEAAQSCVDWSDLERRKEALRYIVKQIWNEAITEREASTPIVPGTAGLSAEQVREVIGDPNMKYNQKVADRLNALLGAAKPAEPGVPLIHGRAELDIHDARIRKSVLEEAAQVIEKDCDMWKPQNLDKPIWSWKDMAANHRSMSSAIRALAERPAPAGEVKGKK